MKANRKTLAAVLLFTSTPALAHHSYAMFDQTIRASIDGTVRTLEWTNPHVWIWIDVKGADGSSVTYGLESNAPSELTRFFGWEKTSLKKGDRVTVQFAPLRSGKNGGALQTITFPDGHQLLTPRSNRPSTSERADAAAADGPLR